MESVIDTQEKIFFSDSNVTVTKSRFVANGKTYAMRNISSVANFEKKKSRSIQILLIVIGIGLCFGDDTKLYGVGVALMGALALYFTKDEYSVRITTNAGEADGFISKDKAYIQNIVNGVNDAIIHRG